MLSNNLEQLVFALAPHEAIQEFKKKSPKFMNLDVFVLISNRSNESSEDGDFGFFILCRHELKFLSPACPTDPFTILEPQNPSIDVSELHNISRSKDFMATKLGKIIPIDLLYFLHLHVYVRTRMASWQLNERRRDARYSFFLFFLLLFLYFLPFFPPIFSIWL